MIPRTDSAIGGNPALIVVDAQQAGPDGPEEFVSNCGSIDGGKTAIMENIATIAEHARDADIPIIWGRELHRRDFADYGAELESCEGEHCMYGTSAESFHEVLPVDKDDMEPAEYVVDKRRYNFFFRTDIEHILSTYDIDTVILAGFMTNICVHYTAHGAHEHDYAFRAVEEATGAPTQELHEVGLTCMRYLQPRGVPGLDEVIRALDAYDGNPLVQRVKETGQITDETGRVSVPPFHNGASASSPRD